MKTKARKWANPNPRIGVLLAHGGASVRLCNVFYRSYVVHPRAGTDNETFERLAGSGFFKPCFRLKGLKWLRKFWPEEQMRTYIHGYGPACSREWHGILKRKGYE